MVEKALLKLGCGRLVRHLRQGFYKLLFSIENVLQLVNEQVVKRFNVFCKKSHDFSPFLGSAFG
jgi:hypothetical protein